MERVAPSGCGLLRLLQPLQPLKDYAVRRRPAASSRDVAEEDRPLQGVELRRCVGGDLGEERVGGEHGGLVGVAGVGVAQQGGDVHLERAGQAVQRVQRRHGLAILNLRDVGARHAHAGGQLALGEIADVAEIADRGSDLQTFPRLGRGRASSGAANGSGSSYLKTACGSAGTWRWLCEIAPDRSGRSAVPLAARHDAIMVAISCNLRADPEQGPRHTSDNDSRAMCLE